MQNNLLSNNIQRIMFKYLTELLELNSSVASAHRMDVAGMLLKNIAFCVDAIGAVWPDNVPTN